MYYRGGEIKRGKPWTEIALWGALVGVTGGAGLGIINNINDSIKPGVDGTQLVCNNGEKKGSQTFRKNKGENITFREYDEDIQDSLLHPPLVLLSDGNGDFTTLEGESHSVSNPDGSLAREVSIGSIDYTFETRSGGKEITIFDVDATTLSCP